MKKHLALIGIALFLIIILAIMISIYSNDNGKQSIEQNSIQQLQSSTNTTGTLTVTGKTVENTEDDDTGVWTNISTITLGANTTYTGNGVLVSGTTVNITEEGEYTITGTLDNGQIRVDTKGKVKLILNGVNITSSDGPAIYLVNSKKTYIVLSENNINKLKDSSTYSEDAKGAIFSNDTLEIKGSGTLNITGNYKHAIVSDDDIIIRSGSINIESAIKDGIHANDTISIIDGTINILSCGSDGVEGEANVDIYGGTLTIAAGDDGIHAATNLNINGGTINITKSYEGLEGKDTITINNGNIKIVASDDGINSGLNLVINGGYIYANCEGDGLDSNGNMTINGGHLVIFSGDNGNGALDIGDQGATCVINGGTIIATGGNMGITISSSSKQYSMWINGKIATNTIVNVTEENGNSLETFVLAKSSSLMFYSSDKLEQNVSYTVSTGGTTTGTLDRNVYLGGTYIGGTSLGTATLSSKTTSIGQSAGGMGGMNGGPGGNKGYMNGPMNNQ